MATLLGSHFVVETEKSGAPYVVRPTRPRSYLDFEKQKAAARRHYRGLTWLGRARRASGAPVWYGSDNTNNLIVPGVTCYIVKETLSEALIRRIDALYRK